MFLTCDVFSLCLGQVNGSIGDVWESSDGNNWTPQQNNVFFGTVNHTVVGVCSGTPFAQSFQFGGAMNGYGMTQLAGSISESGNFNHVSNKSLITDAAINDMVGACG